MRQTALVSTLADSRYIRSLIIKNVNDGPWTSVGDEKLDSVEYKEYLHSRCVPGSAFVPPGDIPPFAEVRTRFNGLY